MRRVVCGVLALACCARVASMPESKKSLTRKRRTLERRLGHVLERLRIDGLSDSSAAYDIAERSALKTALELFDKAIAEADDAAWGK